MPTREIQRPQRASWTRDSSKSEATSCGVALCLPTLSLLEWDKVRGRLWQSRACDKVSAQRNISQENKDPLTMPFWRGQEHREGTQPSTLGRETGPLGGCWRGAPSMLPHPIPPRPLASFETIPEVTAPLADLHLEYRNLAEIDSAQPQPHPRAGRSKCDIRQREGTGGSGCQCNLPSAKRLCPQTVMTMHAACPCRTPGPQAFP